MRTPEKWLLEKTWMPLRLKWEAWEQWLQKKQFKNNTTIFKKIQMS